ncbi:hypothetical protein KCP76_21330 [Salmonella enterica subsp. enterica serovar Weltevreden]|nr:hypothetical protein KCP76_21330 [Salmonella enterica subsp. enterica serovar Weltevreden]
MKKATAIPVILRPYVFALLCTAILLSMALLLETVWLPNRYAVELVKQEDMRSLREVTAASPARHRSRQKGGMAVKTFRLSV